MCGLSGEIRFDGGSPDVAALFRRLQMGHAERMKSLGLA